MDAVSYTHLDVYKRQEKLRQENNIIGAYHSQKAESVSSKRKIMLEIELDDEEYQKMIQTALNI